MMISSWAPNVHSDGTQSDGDCEYVHLTATHPALCLWCWWVYERRGEGEAKVCLSADCSRSRGALSLTENLDTLWYLGHR